MRSMNERQHAPPQFYGIFNNNPRLSKDDFRALKKNRILHGQTNAEGMSKTNSCSGTTARAKDECMFKTICRHNADRRERDEAAHKTERLENGPQKMHGLCNTPGRRKELKSLMDDEMAMASSRLSREKLEINNRRDRTIRSLVEDFNVVVVAYGLPDLL